MVKTPCPFASGGMDDAQRCQRQNSLSVRVVPKEVGEALVNLPLVDGVESHLTSHVVGETPYRRIKRANQRLPACPTNGRLPQHV